MMLANVAQLLELRQPAAPTSRRTTISSLDFDWLYVVQLLLLTFGIMLDTWSHSSFGPDQSVFNAYHLLFYSAAATLGGLLLFAHWRLRQGHRVPWDMALPAGYGLSALGILAFGIGGVGDLTGHALFGFEVGVEALFSPTHMALFVSWALIALGPLRAALARSVGRTPRLSEFLPAMLAFACVLMAFSTMTYAFAPIGGSPYATEAMRPQNDQSGAIMGVGASFIQTGLLFGFLLWLMRRVRLPFGAITLAFTTLGLMFSLRQLMPALPVLFGAGLLIDLLRHKLQPSLERVLQFRLFGLLAPIILWTVYYGLIIATNMRGGIYYTGFVWIGSVGQCGLIGLALAYALTQPAEAANA